MTNAALVPVLGVADPGAASARLIKVFGFTPDAPHRLRLGSQRIELRQGAGGHGLIDHLALAVDDVDAALAQALARGGRLDPETTPDGPLFIPEFWTAGARYVFLEGPEGARIEFCARPGDLHPGRPDHDHIGIACRNLPAMREFFLSLGLTEITATTLIRKTGNLDVAFLGIGTSVVELYAPPGLPEGARAAGHWQRLILKGAGGAGEIIGPEGLVIERRS